MKTLKMLGLGSFMLMGLLFAVLVFSSNDAMARGRRNKQIVPTECIALDYDMTWVGNSNDCRPGTQSCIDQTCSSDSAEVNPEQ